MKTNKETKTTTVTPLEMAVLCEVEACDLNDGTQECFYGPIFHCDFDMKVIRGVISSLLKKGIVSSADETKDDNYFSSTELVISEDYRATDEDGRFVIANVEMK